MPRPLSRHFFCKNNWLRENQDSVKTKDIRKPSKNAARKCSFSKVSKNYSDPVAEFKKSWKTENTFLNDRDFIEEFLPERNSATVSHTFLMLWRRGLTRRLWYLQMIAFSSSEDNWNLSRWFQRECAAGSRNARPVTWSSHDRFLIGLPTGGA